ncbi:helix-turn-helix domain-containing protein [Nitrospirillum amazonense]|nr:helix-turn-helix transcriptional regulator [Nitrospirillum amazonense]MDG3443236.1 helix-turn-helix transcriptional regulator [Nitrospirillum amazonense]
MDFLSYFGLQNQRAALAPGHIAKDRVNFSRFPGYKSPATPLSPQGKFPHMTTAAKVIPNAPAPSPLAERLGRRLSALNLGYAEFERAAGLNEGTIKGIMYGKSASPRADTIYKIARGLGCRIEDLIGESRLGDDSRDEVGHLATPHPIPYAVQEPPPLPEHAVLDAVLDKVRAAYRQGDLDLAAQLVRLFQLDLEKLKIEREIARR